MRATLAVLAAAAVAALGALMLGEYEMDGVTTLAAGVVFGLFIGGAALGVNRRAALALGVAAAILGWAAMTWAGWITTFHDLAELSGTGWAAVALCGLAAGLRAGLARPARDTPAPAPAPAPSPEDRTPS